MPNNKIYLGNLNKVVTESLLRDHFTEYGEISEISLPLDNKNQEPKGYAFITFSCENEAQKALEQDGKEFIDREITVQIATEKRRKK